VKKLTLQGFHLFLLVSFASKGSLAATFPNLERFDLCKGFIFANHNLVEKIKTLENLKHIRFTSQTNIILTSIIGCTKNLESIKIVDCRFFCDMTRNVCANNLVERFENQKSLVKLKYTGGDTSVLLSNAGSRMLSMKTIEYLNMPSAPISDSAYRSLVNNMKNLKYLNLYQSQCPGYIISLFSNLLHLEFLDVSNTMDREEYTESHFKPLEKLFYLKSLTFSGNNVDLTIFLHSGLYWKSLNTILYISEHDNLVQNHELMQLIQSEFKKSTKTFYFFSCEKTLDIHLAKLRNIVKSRYKIKNHKY
jgi:hypothetical protein